MRLITRLVFLFLFSFISFHSKAVGDTATSFQKKLLRLARDYTDQQFYYEAESTYKLYLQKDTADAEVFYELGMLQFTYLFKKDSCIKYLEQSMRLTAYKKDTLAEICNALGQCYQFVEDYDKALIFYELFKKKLKGTEGGKEMKKETDRLIAECNFALDNPHDVKGTKAFNLGKNINTSAPEFDPVASESDSLLFFTSVRSIYNDTAGNGNEELFENIFLANKTQNEFTNAHRYFVFGKTENLSANVSVNSISYDEKQFYVCKSDRIYVATGRDSIWDIPAMMSDSVNNGFAQNHAFVSPDGKTLYFSVNNSGGFGGLDIYKSEKQKDGRWGPARNVGEPINTPFDEESPAVSYDGKTFYFSSKGHLGFGGYDLYKCQIDGDKFSKPVNMGRPYNSSADDLFLKFNKTGDEGYLSSGRIKGFGDMDIYKITCPGYTKPFKNRTYPVSFNANKSLDPEGAKLIYEWNMDDGTKEYGTKFTHTYKRPGNYKVQLTTVDTVSKHKDQNNMAVDVVIDNVSHIEFTCPDTVYQHDTVRFDGSSSMMKGKTAYRYVWKIGDNEFSRNTVKTPYIFKDAGTYTVKMQIEFRCKNCTDVDFYEYSKTITVLPFNRRINRRP